MKRTVLGLVVAATTLSAACSSDNSTYEDRLRAALDLADITLIDAVGIAEAETPEARAFQAALLLSTSPIFAVRTEAAGSLRILNVDIDTGAVLATSDAGAAGADCAQAIALSDALAIAEARVEGEAVAVVWDDDEPCAREIQVLTNPELMEVKVAADGSILEVEVSDEDGSGIDDDELDGPDDD